MKVVIAEWCIAGISLVFNTIDVNECESDNVCEQRCTNRVGSFVCKCSNGYHLMDDGRSCEGNIILSNRTFSIVIMEHVIVFIRYQ